MMKTPLYLSKNGEVQLRNAIADAEKNYRAICAAKNDAYENSGDGWHDNAAYEQLIAQEHAAEVRITQLKEQLANIAVTVPPAIRNTASVQIWSVVKLDRYETKSDKEDSVIWEIMPGGETDLKLNRVAYNAPLAVPLIGLEVGETCEVKLADKKYEYTVIGLFPSREAAGLDAIVEKDNGRDSNSR